jgi:hypothetical protein
MRDEFEDRSRRRSSRPPDDEDLDERPRRRPARRDNEEYADRPLRRRPPREDDDEDDDREVRPRKKKRKKRFAECPHCGCPGHADRVSFTWWGGVLGPALLCHVRCRECGYCYNGKTGSDNMVNIFLYVVIPLGILGAVVLFVTLLR